MFNKILATLSFLVSSPLLAAESDHSDHSDASKSSDEGSKECKACYDQWEACIDESGNKKDKMDACDKTADECDEKNKCEDEGDEDEGDEDEGDKKK